MKTQRVSLLASVVAALCLTLAYPPVSGGGGNGQLLDLLPLSQVKFWAYQIQQISDSGAVDALANSHYDLLVIDPTRTDWSTTETRNFDTQAMVQRLKATTASDGRHRKLVIAYIDIGEAENWRWYWTWSKYWAPGTPKPADWPSWIITRDPDGYAGNFPVAYWDAAWKDIIIDGRNHPPAPQRDYVSVLDEVIRDGFDGIYLDWVEAFSNDDVQAAATRAGLDPASEMIAFVRELRDYARQRQPNFLVIQQNAADLLDGHRELLKVIDGIAQEHIWYYGEADVNWSDPRGYDRPTDPSLTEEYLHHLAQYLAAGVPVFNVEYAVRWADRAYALSKARGFIAYCSRTSLSRLTTTPPPDY